MLEAGEAAFDGVAFLVEVPVEAGRPAALLAFVLAVLLLIAALGDDVLDAPASQLHSRGRMRVRLVGQDREVAEGMLLTPVKIQQRLELRIVPALPCCQDKSDRSYQRIGESMDFCG